MRAKNLDIFNFIRPDISIVKFLVVFSYPNTEEEIVYLVEKLAMGKGNRISPQDSIFPIDGNLTIPLFAGLLMIIMLV